MHYTIVVLLQIVSHDDGEDDLSQVNEDDQPFGLNPGYNWAASFIGFGCDQLRTN